MKIMLAAASAAAFALPVNAEVAMTPDVEAYVKEHRATLSLSPKGELAAVVSLATTLDGSDFGFGSTDTREAAATVALRYGVDNRTEFFAQLPISHLRRRSRLLDTRTSTSRVLGVAGIGVRRLIAHQDEGLPELVGVLAIGRPFGKTPGAQPNVRMAIEMNQDLDPVRISGEVGVSVGTRTGNAHLDFGGDVTFAVHERLALSLGVSWASAGADFGNPLNTGVSMRGSATISSLSAASSVTPFFAVGATQAAPDAVVGVAWSRRW